MLAKCQLSLHISRHLANRNLKYTRSNVTADLNNLHSVNYVAFEKMQTAKKTGKIKGKLNHHHSVTLAS